MRKFLLHVLLLLGAITTFANSNPTGVDNPDNLSWCYSTVKFKNTGCQTVKIYKKSGWGMYYYKTLNPGSYYNQQCYYGNEWVFKVDGDIIGNYVVASCTNKTCDIDTEGCGGNNGYDCGSLPNYLSGLIYMGEFNGSKYFCSNDNDNNWNEATATNAASQYGGHLVVVNSAEENEFLRSKIMASRVWIGFTDEASEGNFKWVNGDPVTYTNWSYGEPNNQGINGGQGDQTVLEKSSGKWKDRNGWDEYEFVIEIPCQAQPVCNGEISGLKIHNIGGGNDLDLTDGATYQLSQLPSQFNIEAMVTGNIESVKFFLSGPVNGDHNENISPYRYGGDNNAMTLTPGSYSLTVKGYSQDNSNGEKCSEKTVHFTITNNVCDGEITGLKFYNLSGGNDLDLTDGATYQLSQLPSQFNIEAMVTGNIESVKFFLNGPVNGDHNENISPYRYGGDNNAMTLTPGNYSLTVKGYSQDNSNGEKCSELTVQFTISNDPPACTSSCNRAVSAIAACSGNGPYTIYLQNSNGGNYFNGGGQTWEECDNGTIHYYGTAFKTQGSTNDDYIAFDLYFSGKTTVPPTDSPKPNACFGYDASTFIYYPETYGTITTPNHGTIHVQRRGPSFQLGLGANHQSPDFGASGWLNFYGSSNYYSVGDVNVALSPDCGPCALLGGDTDGDGVCDQEDCQPDDPNFPTTPGAACNDNDSSTENDRVTSDGCGCKGTPIYVLINEEFEQCIGAEICGDVSINDYVTFNAKYEVTLQPTLGALTLNDNGTFCYESDVEGDDEFRYQVCYFNGVDANPVICKTGISWVIIRSCDPCANLGGDTDGDGVCDQEDCQPDDPKYPATPGTACNDGNPNTENDVVQGDGCSCAGTPVPVCDNVVMGGNIGFLNSCSPTIVYCKEDGDAPLIRDCFSPIGGSGNLEVVWLKSTTSCLPPTTTFANIQNDPHWVVIPNANGLDYQPGQLSESTCFLRCSRRENCDMFIESNIVRIEVNCDLNVDCDVLTITTKVGQIIVDGLDQAPLASVQVFSPDYNTTYFTCPGNCDLPTQVIDLADGDYLVYVKFYDSSFNLICEKYGTYTVPPCQNVGLGGFIGFNNCFGSYNYCPLTEAIPTISNCGDPEGGVGNLEVVWLRSATSCLPPTTTFENIANDPHWEMIPGANGLSYSPTEVTQNTCFLRCVRREGCSTFVESNIISLIIDTDCLLFDRETVSIGDRVWDDYNGDGIQDADEPGLADVFVNLQDENGNSIRWTSTDEDGNYIFFNQPAGSYQLVFSTPAGYEVTLAGSGADLENDSDVDPLTGRTAVFDLVEGDHPRGIDCGFRTAGIFLRAGVNSFDFKTVKGEEHTELYWTHNAGEDVLDYAIERSVNGSDFEEILIQPSQGGRNAELYIDFDIAPATGDNWYRVKLYNTDGTVIHSDPLLVHFADLVDFTLFPNPASDFIKVNLESTIGKQVAIRIIDNLGSVVKTIEIDQVYSKYYQIDLRELKEGHYVIWVMPAEHKAIAKQFVIGKP